MLFRSPPSGGTPGSTYTVISSKTLSSGETEQLIEVRYADDTYDSWSRYRATRSGITPVFSKIMDPGFMIMSLPVAFGFALAIYAVGRWLRRRIERAKAAAAATMVETESQTR